VHNSADVDLHCGFRTLVPLVAEGAGERHTIRSVVDPDLLAGDDSIPGLVAAAD
jgi:hypothetical protein